MSSVTKVPQTTTMPGEELTADDARTTLRKHGVGKMLKETFVRFRYGDGFSHSRALAFQLMLALVPLGIAFVGLSASVHAGKIGDVLREVLLRITPGSTDQIVRETLRRSREQAGAGESLALWLGLLVALIALTTAMGQVERGTNRVYGIQRDRPALQKYGHALLMALSGGLLALVGFLVIVAGGTVGKVLGKAYGWGDTTTGLWEAARFPVGILLAGGALTLLISRSPRRRQPGWSWIAVGAGVGLVLWVVFSYALSLYVSSSGTFGTTYGPLTGVMALLIWAFLSSMALFFGTALCAQLEAVRAGADDPDPGDPELQDHRTVDRDAAVLETDRPGQPAF